MYPIRVRVTCEALEMLGVCHKPSLTTVSQLGKIDPTVDQLAFFLSPSPAHPQALMAPHMMA